MRRASVRRVGAWVVVVAVVVAVDVRRVLAQQQFNNAASLPGLVQQVQQPVASTGERSPRVEWLVNVLRTLEQNGSLEQLLRQGIHDSDASIPDSVAEAIVHGLLGPHEAKSQESMAVGGVEGYYGGGDYTHKDDYGDDSSDDDSSDDDSSDDDSSDDYKSHKHKRRHRKKHHHKKYKCKCKKHKKKKKEDKKDESNVFSKIRGVNIGSTFANIQITGGNATAPETPTPTGFPGSSPSNFAPGINSGWGPGAFGGPGGVPPLGGLPPGAGAGPGGPGLGPGSPQGGGGQGLPGNVSAGAVPSTATPTTTTEVPTTPPPATEAPATDTTAPAAASEAPTTGAPASSATPDPPANKPGGEPGDPKDPPTPLPTKMKPSASAHTPRPRLRR